MKKCPLEISGFKDQVRGGVQSKEKVIIKVGIKSDKINDTEHKVRQSVKMESGQLMPSGLQ